VEGAPERGLQALSQIAVALRAAGPAALSQGRTSPAASSGLKHTSTPLNSCNWFKSVSTSCGNNPGRWRSNGSGEPRFDRAGARRFHEHNQFIPAHGVLPLTANEGERFFKISGGIPRLKSVCRPKGTKVFKRGKRYFVADFEKSLAFVPRVSGKTPWAGIN